MREIALALCCSATVAVAAEMNLGQWLDVNEPRVRTYLQSLKPSQIGKRVAGTPLSDGKRELKGYQYLANLSDPTRGLHMYKFRYKYRGHQFEAHYIWVNKGFPEHDLNATPSCPGEWIEPGGWGVLSGDQYTYQTALPGGFTVVTTCRLPSPNSALVSDVYAAALRAFSNAPQRER